MSLCQHLDVVVVFVVVGIDDDGICLLLFYFFSAAIGCRSRSRLVYNGRQRLLIVSFVVALLANNTL